MTPRLSPNTQAILLLTAPLIVGRASANPDLLSAGEYQRFARHLQDIGRTPADLLAANPADILDAGQQTVDLERLRRLLGRGFQLSQAVERWQARAIWVVSRADADYPRRLKARLRGHAPAVLYGCGDERLLEDGGLAVVGSRHVDDDLIDYTMAVGQLAASSAIPIISGGARGIDQAAMRGALDAGGCVAGVLADSLEKQAMTRAHRNMLLDGRLTLISPYDPNAGFNVGNAMQRNKLIYALADAALVVSSDVRKGGTWAGATEQLEKLKLVPIYVRSTGTPSPGLGELQKLGALVWPDPDTPETLADALSAPMAEPPQSGLDFRAGREPAEKPAEKPAETAPAKASDETPAPPADNPAERSFAVARQMIEQLGRVPISVAEVADALQVKTAQAKIWLNRLVEEGVLEKKSRPVRYSIKEKQLF